MNPLTVELCSIKICVFKSAFNMIPLFFLESLSNFLEIQFRIMTGFLKCQRAVF